MQNGSTKQIASLDADYGCRRLSNQSCEHGYQRHHNADLSGERCVPVYPTASVDDSGHHSGSV